MNNSSAVGAEGGTMRSAFVRKKSIPRSRGFDQLLRGSIKRNIKTEKPRSPALFKPSESCAKCELSAGKSFVRRSAQSDTIAIQCSARLSPTSIAKMQEARREEGEKRARHKNKTLPCIVRVSFSTLHKKGVGFGVITRPREALLVQTQARERFSLQS
jgi:hypothetical protein